MYQDFHQVDSGLVQADAAASESPTEFPLTVTTLNRVLGLSSHWHAIGQADVDRFAAMYRAVLVAMATERAGDAHATVLPDGEAELLREAGRGPQGQPSPAGLVELVARQVRHAPDATALVDGDARISYGDLWARAARLARHLRGHGIGTEDVVAVCLERDAELPVALLGVALAGAAYLPVEPGYPANRVAYMCADAGARAVIPRHRHRDLFAAVPVHVHVDADRPAIAAWPAEPPVPAGAGPDALAYVMYTSGSTGRPKGVQVTVGGLANLLL